MTATRPPPGPSGLPLLGSALAFRASRRLRFLARLHRRHGDVSAFAIGARRFIVVADPALGRAVLANRDDAYRMPVARELAALELVPPPAGDLVRGGGRQPGATPAPRLLADRCAAIAVRLSSRWAAGRVDVRDAAGALATALALEALFDVPVDDPDELHALLRSALTHGRSARWVPRRVREARLARYAPVKARLLGRLPADRLTPGHREGISPLLLAAVSPLSSALAWSLLHLAEDPDRAMRVASDDAWREAFLREVLRHRPPAWVLERTAAREHALAGFAVPVGAHVLVSPWLLHHHPAHWDEPDAFRPERFLAGAPLPGAYLPFGVGPKACPAGGAALAMLDGAVAGITRTVALRALSRRMPEPRAEAALMPAGRPRLAAMPA